jgi:hypothetical protein
MSKLSLEPPSLALPYFPPHVVSYYYINLLLLFFSDLIKLQYTKGLYNIMKTEEKSSNVPKVRIAVLGQMNVGKSG